MSISKVQQSCTPPDEVLSCQWGRWWLFIACCRPVPPGLGVSSGHPRPGQQGGGTPLDRQGARPMRGPGPEKLLARPRWWTGTPGAGVGAAGVSRARPGEHGPSPPLPSVSDFLLVTPRNGLGSLLWIILGWSCRYNVPTWCPSLCFITLECWIIFDKPRF